MSEPFYEVIAYNTGMRNFFINIHFVTIVFAAPFISGCVEAKVSALLPSRTDEEIDAPPANPPVISTPNPSQTTPSLTPIPNPNPPVPTVPAVSPPSTGVRRLYESIVTPKSLDSTANRWLEPHYAYLDTRVAARGKLVVFLAGRTGVPSNHAAFIKFAAAEGFHAIGLRYANDFDLHALCSGHPVEEDCHGRARQEVFDGVDHGPLIAVSNGNSIQTRLVKLLQKLNCDNPTQGWGTYLYGNLPRWSSIIVAGHSHGASTAGRIAKTNLVSLAVMLSGPFDNLEGRPGAGESGDPAAWVAATGVTSAAQFYAFSNSAEPQHAQYLENWDAMGLPGAVQTIDNLSTRQINSHQLRTFVTTQNPHGSTMAGGLPRVNGDEHFAETYRYLLGP